MLLEQGELNCLCCLGSRSCQVRFDKKSRPYAVCLVCGSRIFLKTRAGLSGFAVLSPVIDQIHERAARDAAYSTDLAAQLARLIDSLQARSAAPVVSAASLSVSAPAEVAA